jgi:ribonuclease P/MRP protein subunit RPP40
MLFNMDKCHVIHAGKKNPECGYKWGGSDLVVTEAEKDVGVMITSNLKPKVQCAKAAKKANMVLGQLARGVTYRDKYTFIRLYNAYVLTHLSYAVSAWAPYSKADQEVLEKVQQRAVMMVTNIRGSYEERLALLKMRTLEDRRIRGDMIETYKILTGKSLVSTETWFTLAREKDGASNTRASKGYLNLVQPSIPETDVRRYFFSHRVVPQWNQLPDHVKMAKTTNGFKNSYDSFTGY